MTARQEATLKMYKAVQEFCDNNLATISTNAAFMIVYALFKGIIISITETAILQAQVLSGIATDKKAAKDALCKNAVEIADVVYSYASSINNNTLQGQVNYSYSDLFRLREDLLVSAVNNIYTAANTNLIPLAPFGMTALLLTAFQTTIDAYTGAAPLPRAAAALRDTYSAKIKLLFKQGDAKLKKEMDKLAPSFKTVDPDFPANYDNIRITIDPKTSTTQIKGIVTNAATGLPAVGATFMIDSVAVKGSADINGKYVIIVKHGIRSLTISLPGSASQTISDIEVKLGKAVTKNISLLAA